MSKKEFSSGIDSLFDNSSNNKKETVQINQDSNNINIVRTTILLDYEIYNKIKALAFWERKTIKVIIEDSLINILSNYEEEKLNEILEFYEKNQ